MYRHTWPDCYETESSHGFQTTGDNLLRKWRRIGPEPQVIVVSVTLMYQKLMNPELLFVN